MANAILDFNQRVKDLQLEDMFDQFVANDMYTIVPSSSEDFLGLKLMDDAPKDTRTFKITAYEPPKGTVPSVRPGTKVPVVEKTGLKTTEYTVNNFGEQVVFETDELTQLVEAGRSNANDATIANAKNMIVHTMADMKYRLDSTMERLFWEGCLGAQTIDEYIDGTITSGTLTISTGTREVSRTGDPWSTVASAKVFDDLQALKDSFRGKGVKLTGVYMNKSTYNYITQNTELRTIMQQTSSLFYTAEQVSKVADVDLIVYDEGYTDDGTTYTPFIPDGYIIGIGVAKSGTIQSPVQLASAPNIESIGDGLNITARNGDYVQMIDEKAPVSKGINLTSHKLPVFVNPEAIAFMDVLTV